ncbi:MAG: VCBS repeat-containing protein [Deltaproteobacteria bacterium]|nr:VCBS repeat-containing protein [Deltaproteobacteria bacterium]MBW2069852.1 VCBS repeat-containing protein [Deltaproteobacteria bacterium]
MRNRLSSSKLVSVFQRLPGSPKLHHKLTILLSAALLLLLFGPQAPSGAAERLRVAILPVQIHAPEDMSYLQAGLMDMLTSRIAANRNVEIVDANTLLKAFKRFRKNLNETTARELLAKVDAAYLVSGSLTFFGQGGSIDFKVYGRDPGTPPYTLSAIVEDRDSLLSRFSQVADNISAKGFAAISSQAAVSPKVLTPAPPPPPAIASSPASPPAQAQQQRAKAEPGQLQAPPQPQHMAPAEKLASIKQQLIQEKPVSSKISPQASAIAPLAPQATPWQSQVLGYAPVSMAGGDLLGDGSYKLAAISRHAVYIYAYSQGRLVPMAELPVAKFRRLVWVSVADLNHNGREEIYLTGQKKLSSIKMIASSYVLEWDGEKFATIVDEVNYYLRAVRIAGEATELWGQKSSDRGALLPEIYSLAWQKGSLQAVGELSFPEGANIFNSIRGGITGQQSIETLVINSKRYLLLYDAYRQLIWRSTESYATTENYLEVEIPAREVPQPSDDIAGESGRFAQFTVEEEGYHFIYLTSSALLTDLDGDGRLEVIVVHNIPGFAQLTGSRQYRKSEILSLTWSGSGMLENWKTGDIEGDISSFQVGDLNGDGIQELILCAKQSAGIKSILGEEKSIILCYNLTAR